MIDIALRDCQGVKDKRPFAAQDHSTPYLQSP